MWFPPPEGATRQPPDSSYQQKTRTDAPCRIANRQGELRTVPAGSRQREADSLTVSGLPPSRLRRTPPSGGRNDASTRIPDVG